MLLLFIIYITSCYSYLQIIPKDETIKIFQKIGSNELLFRKIVGHLSINLILSFLIVVFLYLLDLDNKIIYSLNLLIGLFLSISFELLQILGVGRVFSLKDILINFCGYVIISVIVKMSKVILLKRLTYKLIRG